MHGAWHACMHRHRSANLKAGPRSTSSMQPTSPATYLANRVNDMLQRATTNEAGRRTRSDDSYLANRVIMTCIERPRMKLGGALDRTTALLCMKKPVHTGATRTTCHGCKPTIFHEDGVAGGELPNNMCALKLALYRRGGVPTAD